jgi:hypothetical protein
LKSTCDYARNRNILIELFPTQGVTVDLDLYLIRGGVQNAKTVSREANYPPVMKIEVNRALLGPYAYRCGFGRKLRLTPVVVFMECSSWGAWCSQRLMK